MAGGESSGATSVDIDEVAGLMLEKIHHYLSIAEQHKNKMSSCFIPKIQKHISILDRTAYEPSILPIGPYHHGNPCIQTFQKKKWSCLSYILSMNYNVKLHDYLNKMAELEIQARNCYLGEIKMDSLEFLQMLLLDGCFILVHLWGTDGTEMPCHKIHDDIQLDTEYLNEGRRFDSSIERYDVKHANTRTSQLDHIGTSSKGMDRVSALMTVDSEPKLEGQISQENNGGYQDAKWYTNYALHDIFLLENQIPFFVVKTIYEVFADTQDSYRLTENTSKFIEDILYIYPKAIQEADRPKNFHHLLHLCHMYLSPNQQRKSYFKFSQEQEEEEDFMLPNTSNCRNGGKFSRWRCATQYHEAGIEFKRRELHEHRPHSLLDIRFQTGVLEIPFLFIDDITGSRFRNLIALEQTSPHFGNDFTAYAAFISQLISSPKDVSFLVKRGIMVHQMRSDEEVSVIFTGLLRSIDFDRNCLHYLRSTCTDLEEHYQNRINRWMAWLWQNHFSNPWLSLAVVAAILVLVCTILQLIFALLAYINPVADNFSPNFNNTNM